MRHHISVLAIVAIVGAAAVARAQGSADEQSLKTAHETVLRSVTTGNLTLIQAMIHPRATGFFKDSQLLVQLGGNVGVADVIPAVVADLGRFIAVPTDSVFRVVGQVGLVNLTATLTAKKGEKQPDRFVRGTYVYVLEGGNWRLVSWHASDTPLEK